MFPTSGTHNEIRRESFTVVRDVKLNHVYLADQKTGSMSLIKKA